MSDSIQSQLGNALAALSETTTRRIWDPVDFDSDWYRSESEVGICRALCYDLLENAKFEVRATQVTYGSGPSGDLMRKIQDTAKDGPLAEFQRETVELLSRSRLAPLEIKLQFQLAVGMTTERFDEQ